jgi:hypothetical protein
MNYRRHKAVRFEQLLWITTKPSFNARIGFLSNKYIPPRKSRDFTHVLALELLRVSM